MSPYATPLGGKKKTGHKIDRVLQVRIYRKLESLYGSTVAQRYTPRLQRRLAKCAPSPRAEDYSQADAILIAYGDHIQNGKAHPLMVLRHFAEEYLGDMVNTVHLLPFFPYTSDDGFSVSDYRHVNPAMGTWRDVHGFSERFNLMFDFVLNHTSASHPWFKAYRTRHPKYRNYYISAHPGTDLSSVIRPRTTPLLTPYKTFTGKRHVWTTFSADQIDLNFAEPKVLMEMLDVLLYYVEQGAGLIRLDAVGFAWKEIGTPSIHHRNTHQIVQLMRDVLDAVAPWVKLVTETNVPHEENVSYFADGKREAQMVYNFALPPLLLHTLQTGNAEAITKWAATLQTPSTETAFFNFAASHDGIGVRGATGILTPQQIAAMVQKVEAHGGRVSYKTNPDGSTSPYELNSTFFDALSSPYDPQDNDVDRFMVSQAIMLSLAGVPGIYLSSLLGAANWHEGLERTGHNRTLNREKFQLSWLKDQLANPATRMSQVFSKYCHLLSIRKVQPAFHPAAAQRVLNLSPAVFALERISQDERQRIIALHNVTLKPVTVSLQGINFYDLLSDAKGKDGITLQPYQITWLVVS